MKNFEFVLCISVYYHDSNFNLDHKNTSFSGKAEEKKAADTYTPNAFSRNHDKRHWKSDESQGEVTRINHY
jgi:hypothetical protein